MSWRKCGRPAGDLAVMLWIAFIAVMLWIGFMRLVGRPEPALWEDE